MSAYIPRWVSVAWCGWCGEPLAVHITRELAEKRAAGGTHICGTRGTTVAGRPNDSSAPIVVQEYRAAGDP